jgi:phospholipid-binding lipoprotein MlaA
MPSERRHEAVAIHGLLGVHERCCCERLGRRRSRPIWLAGDRMAWRRSAASVAGIELWARTLYHPLVQGGLDRRRIALVPAADRETRSMRGRRTPPQLNRAVRSVLLGSVVVLALAAPVQAQDEINDPLEPINRTIFSLNQLLDMMLIGPASIVYGHLPSPVRMGVRNFVNNIKQPVIFANDLLQGERDRAGISFARFFINSTVGMFGLFDMATEFGYVRHTEDFGQTLGRWGVGGGPYIVLPVLGPSTLRDTVGIVVDSFALDPMTYVAPMDARIGTSAADGVDTRYRLGPTLDELNRNSMDPYATFRTVYLQRRAAEIANGRVPASDEAYEDLFKEEDDAEPTTLP